ncbi:MAG: hypothetical protein LAT61_06335 [Alcanivorax sp.]|nr:hypothetical protein [Alcanivorax sp.]
MDAVLDFLGDHEKLSVPILESSETQREFALLILRMLAGRSSAETPSAFWRP